MVNVRYALLALCVYSLSHAGQAFTPQKPRLSNEAKERMDLESQLDDIHPHFHDSIRAQAEKHGEDYKISPELKKMFDDFSEREKRNADMHAKSTNANKKRGGKLGDHKPKIHDDELEAIRESHPELYKKLKPKEREVAWTVLEEGVECKKAQVEKGDQVTFHFHTLGHNHRKDEDDLDSRKIGDPYTLRVGMKENYLHFDEGLYGACRNEKRLINVPARYMKTTMGILNNIAGHEDVNVHPEEDTQYEVQVLKIKKMKVEL